MFITKKITTYIFISSLSLFSVFLSSDNFGQPDTTRHSKNNTKTESLYTESCDCSCLEAFLIEENKELNKLTNCYKKQIELLIK